MFRVAEESNRTMKRPTTKARSSKKSASKSLESKGLRKGTPSAAQVHALDPLAQQQLKSYDEALTLIQEQKFQRAKQVLEKVMGGPTKELKDRAGVHLRAVEQRLSKVPAPPSKTAEDHYTQGVAMMNLGRWDEAREHLDRALKAAPKADHIVYAMAALDCLTGEAETAMQRLKLAIQLRPENRYHARNDEDFAFLQEDPRFTELLYPEREGSVG